MEFKCSKFNNMRFKYFLIIYYFVQVHNTTKGCHTKIGDFSMDEYFLRI
jgi:hypothetical protein